MSGPGNQPRGYYWTILRLFSNSLVFRYHQLRASPLKPAAVSLALTHRCNSHCRMCNIWKSSRDIPDIKSREMSHEEILAILSHPLFSELVELDLTGGEPHLRDDLVDLVTDIARLKSGSWPKLRSIVITSNGLLPAKIAQNYRMILEALSGTGVDLVSVSSFDGPEDIHDRIRGTRGAYRLVTETLDSLLEIKKEYPNFFPGLKTTILPDNLDHLDFILDFALARNLFYIISPVFFTSSRFSNIDKRKDLELGPAGYEKVARFYSRNELKGYYYYSLTGDTWKSGRKQWACTASYNYLFIEFDGKVYPCEMVSEPVGDLRQQAVEDIWNGPSCRAWRRGKKKIIRCRECYEPGAIRYSACTEGLSYLRFLRKLGESNFGDSWYHEGYSKYLGQ
jgi:MoaA/NifB/PqqE/SkfB family radical SAM enzyme